MRGGTNVCHYRSSFLLLLAVVSFDWRISIFLQWQQVFLDGSNDLNTSFANSDDNRGARYSSHHVFAAAATTVTSSSSTRRTLLATTKSPSLKIPEGKHTFDELRQQFHIHGWRWHNMCLIRDLNRLSSLASSIVPDIGVPSNDDDSSSSFDNALDNLEQAAHFVINVNMKGLQRVESKIFFPWLRKKFKSGGGVPYALEVTTSTDEFTNNQKDLKTKANELLHSVKAAKVAKSPALQMQELGKVANISTEMSLSLERALKLKETKIIPAIAETISERDQKKLNTRVLMKLGILESRIHLVGMHDTVLPYKKEYQTFQQVIPKLPQKMIPKWRKTLYEPKAGALDRRSC